jgi:oligoendopeptidase F
MPIQHPTTWDLTSLYENDTDLRIPKDKEELEAAVAKFTKTWRANKKFMTDQVVLLKALTDYETLLATYLPGGKPAYYFWLRSELDQNDTDLKAKTRSIEQWATELGNKLEFFELELGTIGIESQQRFLMDQRLSNFHHFLERLFGAAKHRLTEAEEKILNLKSSPSYSQWTDMTSNMLSREKRTVLLEDHTRSSQPLEVISSLLNSTDQEVRDTAAASFNSILKANRQVAEYELNAILRDKQINDSLRGFARPDEARHLSDDIETSVVDSLLSTVASRNDIPQRFYALKARLLGKKTLAYNERNVPYGTISHMYTYEQSVELVQKVLKQLDPEFQTIFDDLLNGKIDVYPRVGKSGGAFCVHNLITQPVLILLNHTNQLNDVLTLAHELGHTINNYLMKEKQSALYYATSLATAEVASTFMEDFVLVELQRNASEEERLALNMMKLNDDISTIFRQVACYRFEQELHATFRTEGYLSFKSIGAIFGMHMKAYMGDAVDQSAGSENWWVYWSHIRRYFYVYSYSSGLLISKGMQASYHKDHAFMTQVKTFLSTGTSASPKQIFAAMGINLATDIFWKTGLGEIEQLLAETEKLAKRLGKM